ncbi:MAG: thiamine diphosphokinase [Clostridia bacterium]|nr:thiamine diphosphokinase [Clostridia bacterium]
MHRCVIVGGSDINNYKMIKKYIKEDDFFIFCDSGLNHMSEIGAKPSLIVGDFDSCDNPGLDIETIVLPCEKDDTDTMFAVKEAVNRGFDDFLLIGVSGKRLDHTLGNLYILLYLDNLKKKAKILDDYSEMEIVSDSAVYINDSFSYFSLINISGLAEGINIENAKYNLDNAKINCEYQYGISNEVFPGKIAKVSVNKGKLLLIKDF